MELITGEQLNKVCQTLNHQRCEQMADLLNELCPKYNIDSKDKLHEFLANIVQESGEFKHKEENMNYSAKRICQVWPSRFPTIQQAMPYERSPKALANIVYGSRMGNRPNTDDGYNFRGGGFIGITGRETYTKYAVAASYETPEKAAEAIRNDDRAALDSALWFFSVLKGLNDEAERDEIIRIIKSINGGLIGKDVRLMYYERCKKYVV